MESFFLGLVVDSTETSALLYDDQGKRRAATVLPNKDFSSSRELLRTATLASFEAARDGLLVGAVGLSGLDSAAHRQSAARMLAGMMPSNSLVLVGDFLEMTLAGATDFQPGRLFYSCSEAAVASLDQRGNFAKAEAPRDPMGAEGSALWLGTRTLLVLTRMMTGKMAIEPRLVQAVEGFFGFSLEEGLAGLAGIEPERVKGLSQVTLELSTYPDPVPACRALVLQACRRLRSLAAELPNPAGSWYQGSGLVGSLREELAQQLELHEWNECRAGAVEGAVGLAQAGHRVRDDLPETGVTDLSPLVWQKAFQSGRPNP
ncbi:MAG: hypothetical protein AB7S38_19915 [Vulcanimicrobiota bacterium]